MNLLGNLFGSLTSGLIRLAVGVGIVFACYLFILKPVLNTTGETIKASGIEEIGKTIGTVSRRVQREIRHAFNTTGSRADRKRLTRCIKHSHGNVKRIERCARRF